MTWHDETPWAAKRRQSEAEQAEVVRRIERIDELVDMAKTGRTSMKKALSEIEEVAREGADAIVRVGGVHVPQLRTSKEEAT